MLKASTVASSGLLVAGKEDVFIFFVGDGIKAGLDERDATFLIEKLNLLVAMVLVNDEGLEDDESSFLGDKVNTTGLGCSSCDLV